PVRDLEIVLQRQQVRMTQRDRRFLQPAIVLAHPEQIVGAGLDPDFDGLAALCLVRQRDDPFARLAVLARKGGIDIGQPELRLTVRADDAALAVKVEQQDGIPPGDALRQRAGKAEPGAIKYRLAPPLAGDQMQLQTLAAVRKRYRLGRYPSGC